MPVVDTLAEREQVSSAESHSGQSMASKLPPNAVVIALMTTSALAFTETIVIATAHIVADWSSFWSAVQAIGSIVAIAAAIWIGHRSDLRARTLVIEERDRQARIAASTVAAKIGNVAIETERKSKLMGKLIAGAKPGPMTIDNPQQFKCLFIVETHVSEARSGVLLFDSDTGVLAGTVFDTVEGHNQSIETALNVFLTLNRNGEELSKLCTEVRERFKYLSELAAEIEHRIEGRYDLTANEDDV